MNGTLWNLLGRLMVGVALGATFWIFSAVSSLQVAVAEKADRDQVPPESVKRELDDIKRHLDRIEQRQIDHLEGHP